MRIKSAIVFLGFLLALTTASRTPAQDSTSTAQPVIADSLAVRTDSATAAPLSDSLSAPPDSSVITPSDSLPEESPADSLEPGAEAPFETPAEELRDSLSRVRRPVRNARESLLARVIPWDWDQYTNVTEVGLKSLRDSLEYSLTRNAVYDTLFIRYRGQVVRVRGQISRDADGFLNMTVNAIVPPDTTAAKAGGAGNP